MKINNLLLLILLIVSFAIVGCKKNTEVVNDKIESDDNIVLTNQIFKLDMPTEFDGLYETEVKTNAINIFDKESKQKGYIGLLFGLYAYENPKDWAGGPIEKLGEFILDNGKNYDLVMAYPTESQWGFDTMEMPANYKKIYDKRYEIAECVSGLNGEKVEIGKGCRGKDLYNEELYKHLTAIKEKWDIDKLRQENMSPMYSYISNENINNNADVGYIYKDINYDGIDELLIGEIGEGEFSNIIYDLYTMVDRKPAHVFSGWDRNRYYLSNADFIINEYSQSATESGYRLYALNSNDIELGFQYALKYDENENAEKPYFVSYDVDENGEIKNWENIEENEFKRLEDTVSNHNKIEYISFSTIK